MSFLVANVPPVKCFVLKEFLYNHEKGFGELEPAIWLTAKTIKGQALRIESLLPDYGALFDKLPLSAYVWKKPDYVLPLDHLEIWDCLAYHCTVIEKSNLRGLKVKFFGKDKKFHFGNYLFTIDFCNPDPNIIDTTFSEGVEEHKSFNMIKLDNGQFACQPNNRCLWYDVSLVPDKVKFPDFKIPTTVYTVENRAKWSAGGQDAWFYQFNEVENKNV
jgi:hypothetical protein